MKVILKTQYAGPRGTCSPGAELDLPEDEAAELVHGGFATYLVSPPELTPEPETEIEPELAPVKERPTTVEEPDRYRKRQRMRRGALAPQSDRKAR